MVEFAHHPHAVSGDPEIHRQVVYQFGGYMSGLPGDQDGNGKRRDDHDYTRQPEVHGPTSIFEKP
jgi:hypothetical protein